MHQDDCSMLSGSEKMLQRSKYMTPHVTGTMKK
jgi:hypothetical protein